MYSKELPIKLSNTTGVENSILWSFDTTDPYTMGSSDTSSTILFDDKSILNVAPFQMIGNRRVNYAELHYFYLMTNPEVEFTQEPGIYKNSVTVGIKSTRPQVYSIYYTLDGSTPKFVQNSNTKIWEPAEGTLEYTGSIPITKTTTIKVKNVQTDKIGSTNNPINSSDKVYEATYTISSGQGGSGNGTDITKTKISSDTVWTLSGSPYRVAGNLTIDSGSTLSIEDGVEVLFGDSKGLTVNGNLVSYGTNEKPVIFRGLTEETVWDGISMTQQSGNTTTKLKNINISNANTGLKITTEANRFAETVSGVVVHDCDNGINIVTDGIELDKLEVYSNSGYGINIGSPNVTIVNSDIHNNGNGVNLSSTGTTMKGNSIHGNSVYAVYVDTGCAQMNNNIHINLNSIKDNNQLNVGSASSSLLAAITFDFENNYWGTDISSQIYNSIVQPSESHPVIWYEPYLTTPVFESIVTNGYIDGAYIKADINRYFGMADKADIITAVYGADNGLKSVFTETDVELPDNGQLQYSYDKGLNISDSDTVKVFVWNSLKEMIPLSK